MRFGIDVGGVIISRHSAEDTSFFSDNYLSTPMNDLAVEAVRTIVAEPTSEVYIISKAGPRVAQKTLDWLAHTEFCKRTGVGVSRIVFCPSRRQKTDIARLLELDMMIDDNVGICANMREAGIAAIEFTSWSEVLETLGLELGTLDAA